MQKGKLLVPFSLEEGTDPIIDFVVDKRSTPDTGGLALRMFFVTHLGEPGVKVDLKDTPDEPEGSPADKLEKFTFGVFSSGYDAWTDNGPTFAEVRKTWKPNFRPDYPVDKVYRSPTIGDLGSKGKYHDFMVTYGGCNVLGNLADEELARRNASHLQGAMADIRDPKTGRAVLALGPNLDVVWFTGENPNGPGNIKVVADAKQAASGPVAGMGEFEGKMNGSYEGKLFAFKDEGWEPVALVGPRPLIVRKAIGGAPAYVYLGELVKDGGAAIRTGLHCPSSSVFSAVRRSSVALRALPAALVSAVTA